jgi:oligogalacturonide transport system substrate-binding protein
VTIEPEYGGFDGYNQKIKTQLAGSTAPDIIQLDQPWLAELTKGQEVLSDLSKSSMDLSGFNAQYLKDFVTYNNKIVGLPMGTNGRTLIINKSLAGKLGVDYSKGFSWDSLIAEAKRIRSTDSKYYLMNSDMGVVQLMWTSYVRQLSGSSLVKEDGALGFTKEQAVEGFTWIKQAYEAGVFQPMGESQLFSSKTDQNPKWINQELVAIEGWSSEITKFQAALPKGTEIDVTLPPLSPNAKTGAALVRPSMVVSVNNKSENKEEAIKFVNWLLTNKDAAVTLGDVRAVPALETTRQAIVDAGKLDKNVAKAVDLATSSQAIPDTALSQNSQISEITNDLLQKIAFVKLTPEQAADELVKRLTDKVKELKG